MTYRTFAKEFIDLYEAIDGDTQEMSYSQLRLVNKYWPIYEEAKRDLQDQS